MQISLNPIGFAKNQEKKHFGRWRDIVSNLVIDKQYEAALTGLEDYSHLIVVYWMHDIKTCDIRHVPQGKVGEVPEVGIFACRCPQRPNPVGVSTVEIVSINDNIVTVKGLDVIANTPIIDIKPYTPQYDAISNARVPEWVYKLDY